MSPTMITRYSRFADQKRLARAAVGRLEGHEWRTQRVNIGAQTVKLGHYCKAQMIDPIGEHWGIV
jgi:hypothetical protein